MGYSGAGSVSRMRDTVSTAKADEEAMTNLAYVVNSANDNISSLQRTVKLQEKELADKSEHGAALQRNYETLSRIRKSDQKEFIALKALQAEGRAFNPNPNRDPNPNPNPKLKPKPNPDPTPNPSPIPDP